VRVRSRACICSRTYVRTYAVAVTTEKSPAVSTYERRTVATAELPPTCHGPDADLPRVATELPPTCHRLATDMPRLPPSCHGLATELPPSCHGAATGLPPTCHGLAARWQPRRVGGRSAAARRKRWQLGGSSGWQPWQLGGSIGQGSAVAGRWQNPSLDVRTVRTGTNPSLPYLASRPRQIAAGRRQVCSNCGQTVRAKCFAAQTRTRRVGTYVHTYVRTCKGPSSAVARSQGRHRSRAAGVLPLCFAWGAATPTPNCNGKMYVCDVWQTRVYVQFHSLTHRLGARTYSDVDEAKPSMNQRAKLVVASRVRYIHDARIRPPKGVLLVDGRRSLAPDRRNVAESHQTLRAKALVPNMEGTDWSGEGLGALVVRTFPRPRQVCAGIKKDALKKLESAHEEKGAVEQFIKEAMLACMHRAMVAHVRSESGRTQYGEVFFIRSGCPAPVPLPLPLPVASASASAAASVGPAAASGRRGVGGVVGTVSAFDSGCPEGWGGLRGVIVASKPCLWCLCPARF
jgi:hypothetical protein